MVLPKKSSPCDVCNPSSLALLFLRPSPVALDAGLAIKGSRGIEADLGLLKGLVPDKALTSSRYALRTLRAGFLHIHIPSPPAGVAPWLVFKITAAGEMLPMDHPVAQMAEFSCGRDDHNPAGLRLVDIPKAHQVPLIWAAYSADLWNEQTRKDNAANPKAMQRISLDGKADNSFAPTEEALKGKVLECGLGRLEVEGTVEPDYPFTTANAKQLADNLQSAAERHPKTTGKAMAVVLRDPVGLVAELNSLRLVEYRRAQAAIEAEAKKPENEWNLQAAQALQSLKDFYSQVEYAKAVEVCAPFMTYGEYAKPAAVSPLTMGATLAAHRRAVHAKGQWEPVETLGPIRDDTMGRLWRDDLITPRYEKAFSKAWGDVIEHLKAGEPVKTTEAFHKAMREQHFARLAKLEADWWMVRQQPSFADYFEHHFDENDPNTLRKPRVPGLVYACEAHAALTPQPYANAEVVRSYVAQLEEDISKPNSVLLRAMCANQAEVIKKAKPMLEEDSSDNALEAAKGRNDKVYEFVFGLVAKGLESASPKYAWLSKAVGNVMAGYTMGFTASATAALITNYTMGLTAIAATTGTTAAALQGASKAANTAGARKLAGRVRNLAWVQRAIDTTLKSIVNGGKLAIPMEIRRVFSAGDAAAALRMHNLLSPGAAGFVPPGRPKVTLAMVTDSTELSRYVDRIADDAKALQDPTRAAVWSGVGQVRVDPDRQAVLLRTPDGGRTVTLDAKGWVELFHSGKASKEVANKIMREAMAGTGDALNSLEGRLALGGVLLNAVQLFGALDGFSAEDRFAFWISSTALLDAGSGVLGGLAQLASVGMEARLKHQAGEEAVKKSATAMGLRVAGYSMGMVAGLANGVSNFLKAGKAAEGEQTDAAALYRLSSGAYFLTLGTATALTLGALNQYILAGGVVRNAAIRRAALSVGGRFATAGAISALSGWGLVILALGVIFEVAAMKMTPTEIQKWAGRSRFGKRSGGKFSDWKAEERALMELLDPPPKVEKKTEPLNYTVVPIIGMAPGPLR